MIKLIDRLETKIAVTLFFPLIAAIRRFTKFKRNGLSGVFYVASVITAGVGLFNREFYLFSSVLFIIGALTIILLARGRGNFRPIAGIRIPLLIMVILTTIPAILTGQAIFIVATIFYLFCDYNSMIIDVPLRRDQNNRP